MAQLVSIKETATETGVSTCTIRRLIDQKAIKCVRVGRRVMVPRAEVDRVSTQGASRQ